MGIAVDKIAVTRINHEKIMPTESFFKCGVALPTDIIFRIDSSTES